MAKGIMYVDNIRVEFDDEPTIMDGCRKAGVEMPNFCFHSDLSVYGACRMCMVEDLDTGKIDAACTTKPKNGMRIRTNTSRLLKYRRMILELMLASHCRDCTACEKNRSCRLQEMAVRFGIHHVHFKDTREHVPMDFSSPAVTFDLNKCILCGDCVRVCKEVQGMSILHFAGRGPGLHIEAGDDQPISTTLCVSCGQCAAVCTTGAITVKNDIGAAWRALHDPQKRVVIQIAPAVRVAIGEAYGLPAGENEHDKLVTALKIMGADEIYDTIFGADLTVREESKEFLRRLETGENLPLMTYCCPSWVRYVEQERPQFIKNLSSALSPMQMFATVLKDKYREKAAAAGRPTFHIAIMPCTAKKMEAGREEFRRDGVPNVDLVLTTQEVIRMMKEDGIQEGGHLQINRNIILWLTDLHNQLLQSSKFPFYTAAYYKALPYIVELRNKGDKKDVSELENCFDALYGVLLLRLQHKPISDETAKAVADITKLLAMLSDYYKQDKAG